MAPVLKRFTMESTLSTSSMGMGSSRYCNLHQAPEGVGLRLVVHQRGVLLEQLIVCPCGRPAGADGWSGGYTYGPPDRCRALVGAHGVQRASRSPAPAGQRPWCGCASTSSSISFRPMPPTRRHGVGEVLVDHLSGNADGLENLGGLVGLDGGDAHFGGDLHDAVENSVVVVVHRGVRSPCPAGPRSMSWPMVSWAR